LCNGSVGFEEWKPEDRLRELAREQPHRYQHDEQGGWCCPPGEEAARAFGLEYYVRSSYESGTHHGHAALGRRTPH
jgi:hypothetical protein